MRWLGARTSSKDTQSYYTQPKLSEYICKIVSNFKGPYIELGVGEGSIFKKLPRPKMGVELRDISPKIPGVLQISMVVTLYQHFKDYDTCADKQNSSLALTMMDIHFSAPTPLCECAHFPLHTKSSSCPTDTRERATTRVPQAFRPVLP